MTDSAPEPKQVQRIYEEARRLAGRERESFLHKACEADAALRAAVDSELARADAQRSRFDRVEKIFHRALEFEGGELEAFLEQETEGDPELRQEVDELLDKVVTSDHPFLQAPPNPAAALAKDVPGDSRVGEYELRERLGHGGMGIVFLAHQPRLDREAAVKVLAPHLRSDPRCSAQFLREARALARVRHPNIVEVYGVDESRELGPYIAMEYVAGEKLDRWVQASQPSPREIVSLLLPLADALEALHQQGVFHRDISPSNILVERANQQVRLVDFGLAFIEGATRWTVGPAGGTPAFMSPEQQSGSGYDARAEVFGLGSVLYNAWTGKSAVESDLPQRLSGQIAQSAFERKLAAVCFKAMSPRPEDRYEGMVEFKADLNALLEGAPLSVQSSGWTRLSWRLRTQARLRATLWILALIAVGISVWWWTRPGEPRASYEILAGSGAVVCLERLGLLDMPLGEVQEVSIIGELEPGRYKFTVIQSGDVQGRFVSARPDEHLVLEFQEPTARAEKESAARNSAMVRIQGGAFVASELWKSEAVERVVVDDFLVDPDEVSNGQYQEFLQSLEPEQRAQHTPSHWEELHAHDGWSVRPVTGVRWDSAVAYSHWRGARLLTFWEWGYLVKLSQHSVQWSKDPEELRQRFVLYRGDSKLRNSLAGYLQHAEPVSSGSESVRHLPGNVVEWLATPFDPPEGLPVFYSNQRVIVGAAWWEFSSQVFSPWSFAVSPLDGVTLDRGFRCGKCVVDPRSRR